MPCELVNSVMISPQPPWLRIRRRKTVSVTPAMGANTVAGAILTGPIWRVRGTTCSILRHERGDLFPIGRLAKSKARQRRVDVPQQTCEHASSPYLDETGDAGGG